MCNLQYAIYNCLWLVGKQRGAEVALAVAGGDEHDQLAGILGPSADLKRNPGGGAGADSDHQAFFLGQAPCHIEGRIIRDLHDLVDNLSVQHTRNETSPDALNLVWASLPARQHRRALRLDRDRLEAWLARLDHLGHTSDRSA